MDGHIYILSIETSTDVCSVAISDRDKFIAGKCTDEPKSHASMLAPMIKELMDSLSLSFGDLSAVAVSSGPGSYTGLRVGVSTAKGICYGAGKPLLAVDTLQVLAFHAVRRCVSGSLKCGERPAIMPDSIIVPMIDARRMEVYSAVFDSSAKKISPTEAVVLDSGSYADIIRSGRNVVFVGNGAGKFRQAAEPGNTLFLECSPLAEDMAVAAYDAFSRSDFKDVAYFEPFYLKDFVAGVSKKKIF